MTDPQGPAGADEPVDYLARVASGRALRDMLTASARWGVSPSRFLGRPAETDYLLDEHGRVARAVTDPDWTDDDRGYALALVAYESTLCAGCRQPLTETTAADHEGEYSVDVARCHACTALATEAKGYAENPHPHALRFGAQLRVPTTEGPSDAAALDPADG